MSDNPSHSNNRLPIQDPRPLVGVSSCLVGNRVRYDGQHRYNHWMEQICEHVRLLPFCPEAMAGMGIPRAPVNVVQTDDGLRVLGRDNPDKDVTDRLTHMGDVVANVYPHLCGFIVQSRSPSCGLNTTPIYSPHSPEPISTNGSGVFSHQIQQRFPGLPILNDSELNEANLHLFLYCVMERAAMSAPLVNAD